MGGMEEGRWGCTLSTPVYIDTLSVFFKTFQCDCAILASGCLAGILIINNNILHLSSTLLQFTKDFHL